MKCRSVSILRVVIGATVLIYILLQTILVVHLTDKDTQSRHPSRLSWKKAPFQQEEHQAAQNVNLSPPFNRNNDKPTRYQQKETHNRQPSVSQTQQKTLGQQANSSLTFTSLANTNQQQQQQRLEPPDVVVVKITKTKQGKDDSALALKNGSTSNNSTTSDTQKHGLELPVVNNVDEEEPIVADQDDDNLAETDNLWNNSDALLQRIFDDDDAILSSNTTTTTMDTSFGNHLAKLLLQNGTDPNQPQKRLLPSCQRNPNGCILLFFHIPKTGGSTLFASFRKRKKELAAMEQKARRRERVRRRKEWKAQVQSGRLDKNTTKPIPLPPPILKNWYTFQRSIVGAQYQDTIRHELFDYTRHGIPINKTKIQIYELHGANNPSFVKLLQKGYLQEWKRAALHNNITFFAFTMLREPISWSLSAYHMMCATQGICQGPHHNSQEKYLANATSLSDFDLAIQPNPQCGFLFQSGLPYHRNVEQWTYHPLPNECRHELWLYLTTYMDWVGTMEHYNETMAILNAMTGLDVSIHVTNAAKEEKRLTRGDLKTNATIESKTIAMNALDTELYRRVQEYYTLDGLWTIQDPLPLSFF